MNRVGAIVLLVFIASGCASREPRAERSGAFGYRFDDGFDTSRATIALPIFVNNTFSTGLEIDLAAAVAAEVDRATPWSITDEQAADGVLRGVIAYANIRPLATGRGTGYVSEIAYQITVDFEYVDNRSGEVIVGRRGFSSSGTWIAARSVGERIEVGQLAAVERLARDIVAELRSDWE